MKKKNQLKNKFVLREKSRVIYGIADAKTMKEWDNEKDKIWDEM